MIFNIYSISLDGAYSFVLLAENNEDAFRQYNYIFGNYVEDETLEEFHVKLIKEGTICSLGTINFLTGEVLGVISKIVDLKEVVTYGN